MSQQIMTRGQKISAAMSGNTNKRTHGMTDSPTWTTWQSMLARCRYSNRHNSKGYSGKGVRVCSRWLKFENFIEDMGERPQGMTLDRIDTAGNYEPQNCRWANATDQARNRTNARLTLASATAIASAMLAGAKSADVAREYGCSESLPREIMRGRTWRDALDAANQAASADGGK